jgi:hypothetical protein
LDKYSVDFPFKRKKYIKSGVLGELIQYDSSYQRPYVAIVLDDFTNLKNIRDDWNEIKKLMDELTIKYGIDVNSQEFGPACELLWLRNKKRFTWRELAMYMNYKTMACLIEWIGSEKDAGFGTLELDCMLRLISTDTNLKKEDLKSYMLDAASDDQVPWDIDGNYPFSSKNIANRIVSFEKQISSSETIKVNPNFFADVLFYKGGLFDGVDLLLKTTRLSHWEKDKIFISKWKSTMDEFISQNNYIQGDKLNLPTFRESPGFSE